MKTLCILLIVCASAGLGSTLAASGAERVRTLSAVAGCIRAMAGGMLHRGSTFHEALLEAGKLGMASFFRRCADIAAADPALDGGEVCARALAGERDCALSQEERSALEAFMQRVAAAASADEIQRAGEEAFGYLDGARQRLAEEQRRKGRMLRSVCLLGGIAVGVLLI